MNSVRYYKLVNDIEALKTSLSIELALANELSARQLFSVKNTPIKINKISNDINIENALHSVLVNANVTAEKNGSDYSITGKNLKNIETYKINLESSISRVEALETWCQKNAQLTKSANGSVIQINKNVNTVLDQVEDAYAYNSTDVSVAAGRKFQAYVSLASTVNNFLLKINTLNKELYTSLITKKVLDPSLPKLDESTFKETGLNTIISQIHDSSKKIIITKLGGVDKNLENKLTEWESASKKIYGDSALSDLNLKTLKHNSSDNLIIQGNKFALLTKFTQEGLNGLDKIIGDHSVYGLVLHNTTTHLGALKFGSFIGKSTTTASTLPDAIELSVLDPSATDVLQAARYVSDYLGFTISTARGFYTSYKENGDAFFDIKQSARDLKTQLLNDSSKISDSLKSFFKGETVLNITPNSSFKETIKSFPENYFSSSDGWKLSSKGSALKEISKSPFSFTTDALLLGSSIYSLASPNQSTTDIAIKSASLVGTSLYAASDILSVLKGKNFIAASEALGVVGGVTFLALSFKGIYDVNEKYAGDYSSRISKFDLSNSIIQSTAATVGVALSIANPIFALPLLAIPNFSAIGTALDMQTAKNQAIKEGDIALAQVLDIMHKGAALDASPIINWFSVGYTAAFKSQIQKLQDSSAWQHLNYSHQSYVIGEKIYTEIVKLKATNTADSISYIGNFITNFINPYDKPATAQQGLHYLLEVDTNAKHHSESKLPAIHGLNYTYDIDKISQNGNHLTIIDLTNPKLSPIDPRQTKVDININIDYRSDKSYEAYYLTKKTAESNNYVSLKLNITDLFNKSSNSFFSLTPDSNFLPYLKDIKVTNQTSSSVKTILDLSNIDYANNKETLTTEIKFSSYFDVVYGPKTAKGVTDRPIIYFYFGAEHHSKPAELPITYNGTFFSKGNTDIYVYEENSNIHLRENDTAKIFSTAANIFLDDIPKSVVFNAENKQVQNPGNFLSAETFNKAVTYLSIDNSGWLTPSDSTASNPKGTTLVTNATKFHATDFNDTVIIKKPLSEKFVANHLDYVSLGKGSDTLEASYAKNLTVLAGEGGDKLSFDSTSFLNLQLNQGANELSTVTLKGHGDSNSINIISGNTIIRNDVNSDQSNQSIGTGEDDGYLNFYSGKGNSTIYIDQKSSNHVNILDNHQRAGAIKLIIDNVLDYTMKVSSVKLDNSAKTYPFADFEMSKYLDFSQPLLKYDLTNSSEKNSVVIYTNLANSAPIILSDNLHQDALIGISQLQYS